LQNLSTTSATVVSPLSTTLKIRRRTRPEVPAQTPYSSRVVKAQVRHSTNTGQTSHSFEARRTALMDMVGWSSSFPK